MENIMIKEITVTGDKETWLLLHRRECVDFTSTTEAMEIEDVGCVVRTALNDGISVAISTVFVPNTCIVPWGGANKLEQI